MTPLDQILSDLPIQHQRALNWFREHTGKITGWPQPLPDGTFLASKAKGIYKPEWSKYALSIRQNLNSPYPDMPPIRKEDGTWLYAYFQEDLDPGSRDMAYTNVALLNCKNDVVPVGVMRQIKPKPAPLYFIEGLAFVTEWADGFFTFEGVSLSGARYESLVYEDSSPYCDSSDVDDIVLKFEAGKLLDARKKVSQLIAKRQGQPAFRKSIVDVYQASCAITEYDAIQALEAAHILPYRGSYTNHVCNGILLRSDIHSLFDQGLIAINPNSMSVLLSSKLSGTKYESLEGRSLRVPIAAGYRPSEKALRYHARWAGLL
jgi:putative restriction endonuclease